MGLEACREQKLIKRPPGAEGCRGVQEGCRRGAGRRASWSRRRRERSGEVELVECERVPGEKGEEAARV